MFDSFNSKGFFYTKIAFVSQALFTLDNKPLYYVIIEDIEGRVINSGTYLLESEIDFTEYHVFWLD
jgi:hypothetical protein